MRGLLSVAYDVHCDQRWLVTANISASSLTIVASVQTEDYFKRLSEQNCFFQWGWRKMDASLCVLVSSTPRAIHVGLAVTNACFGANSTIMICIRHGSSIISVSAFNIWAHVWHITLLHGSMGQQPSPVNFDRCEKWGSCRELRGETIALPVQDAFKMCFRCSRCPTEAFFGRDMEIFRKL